MTKIILALSVFFSLSNAIAANPGVICVQSTAVAILIEPTKSQVRVTRWSEIAETLPIVKSDVRFLERMPPIWQTTYDLGEGYKVVTSFNKGADKGTGVLYINGEAKINYSICYKSEDIKR